MKPIPLIKACLLALALGGTATSAMGAAAIAYGSGTFKQMIVDAQDKASAEREAVEKCAEQATNCQLLMSNFAETSYAVIKSETDVNVAKDPNPDEARRIAVAGANLRLFQQF